MSSSQSSLKSPADVLSFWFGGEWNNNEKLNDPQFMFSLFPLWWGLNPDFSPLSAEEKLKVDQSTLQFIETVRAVGTATPTAKSPLPSEWDTLDGTFAKLILCDQICRNCFRGTDEAFAYGSTSLSACRQILSSESWRGLSLSAHTFLTTAFQHSEDVEDHKNNVVVVENVGEKFGLENMMYLQLKKHCEDHKAVIDRFGRYPHRNELLGRESTEEEAAYLSDIDSLHDWEKSQTKK
ncbi:hypothetical protein TrVE_jg671 [Triparma verrucosa]|uniref:DUF924-domain-containing protein n=1 Tax=Triparma verrucosa TaxID=1606542 RepID=A0A9W7CA61_9STRA|nr:hypothetical protein TrVE_jg671 [Triparma verrucosa]